MKEDALVIRTNFDSDSDWNDLKHKIETPNSDFGFLANVEFISDIKYNSKESGEITKLLPSEYNHSFFFIADSNTFKNEERTILCVSLEPVEPRLFRVTPTEMWSVENNLSLVNMEFLEFANSCDEDGVFRGF